MNKLDQKRLTAQMQAFFPCSDDKRDKQERHFFSLIREKFQCFSMLGLREANFDRDFLDGPLDQFYARFWEIEVAIHLHRLGYTIEKNKKNFGPDFRAGRGDTQFLIEARILNPTESLKDPISPVMGKMVAGEVPADEILLRYTQALLEKRRKIEGYIHRCGDPNLPIVIALNAYRIFIPFHDGSGTHFPFVVRAVLPYGKQYLTIDTQSFKTVDQGILYRNTILKGPSSPVAIDAFLNDEWRQVSVVIASHRMFESDIRRGLVAVHNPKATRPLSIAQLGVRAEYLTSVIETPDQVTITTRDINNQPER